MTKKSFIPFLVNWAVWSTSCLNISGLYFFQHLYYSVLASFVFIIPPFMLHRFKTLLIYSLVTQKSSCIFLTYFKALFSISWLHSAYFLYLSSCTCLLKCFFFFFFIILLPSSQECSLLLFSRNALKGLYGERELSTFLHVKLSQNDSWIKGLFQICSLR